MKNLNQFGVQELNTTEAKGINGGGFFSNFLKMGRAFGKAIIGIFPKIIRDKFPFPKNLG